MGAKPHRSKVHSYPSFGIPMKSFLSRWFNANKPGPVTAGALPSPIASLDDRSLDLTVGAVMHEDLPHPDWDAVNAWVESFGESRYDEAFTACERAWLGLLARGAGDGYRVFESAHVLLMSDRPDNEALAALEFVDKTRRRVRHLLEDLAGDDGGKEVMLAFADAQIYSRYLRRHIPDLDDTMVSAGVYLHTDSAHFVTYGDELWRLEPTIVHELTHAQLAHLPLPLWVNEGLAVNSEQRLTRRGADVYEVQALERKHAAFWTPDTIQEFWNGSAFKRPDDGSELAYDLARLLVNGMCADWPALKQFVAAAHADDAGNAAAATHLGVDLGEAVRHFLEREDGVWEPRPFAWTAPAVVEAE